MEVHISEQNKTKMQSPIKQTNQQTKHNTKSNYSTSPQEVKVTWTKVKKKLEKRK